MFDNKKNKTGMFAFDLEKDLKGDHAKAKKLLKEVDEKQAKLKSMARSGASKEDFEKMTAYTNAYQALHRVITRLASS